MHGLRLRPGSALIELRVRLFNRTPLTQTFLWWANVAARVHERDQSFFPPDVHYVADHAVRAQSTFPRARQPYYGVPYHQRPAYIELMAGVFTDNQPDFSYLLPYETRTFSQFWWPIQKTRPRAAGQRARRTAARRGRGPSPRSRRRCPARASCSPKTTACSSTSAVTSAPASPISAPICA